MMESMNLWIDGDACPKQIKQILFRAAVKRQISLSIVANHFLITPPSSFIKRVMVERGFDSADRYIVEHVMPNDLVITSDILLAELVIDKSAYALSPRGILFCAANIKEKVAIRNMSESLRSAGLIQGGAPSLHQKEVVLFSNQLDKLITRLNGKTS
jgi:uncharacterized protein